MFTNEQLLEKHRLEITLSDCYSDIFKRLAREMIFDLDELAIVTTTAYGIDRESLFYSSVKDVLEKRERALENIPNPAQLPLFPELEVNNVT